MDGSLPEPRNSHPDLPRGRATAEIHSGPRCPPALAAQQRDGDQIDEARAGEREHTEDVCRDQKPRRRIADRLRRAADAFRGARSRARAGRRVRARHERKEPVRSVVTGKRDDARGKRQRGSEQDGERGIGEEEAQRCHAEHTSDVRRADRAEPHCPRLATRLRRAQHMTGTAPRRAQHTTERHHATPAGAAPRGPTSAGPRGDRAQNVGSSPSARSSSR